jgi:hypothetical protein
MNSLEKRIERRFEKSRAERIARFPCNCTFSHASVWVKKLEKTLERKRLMSFENIIFSFVFKL